MKRAALIGGIALAALSALPANAQPDLGGGGGLGGSALGSLSGAASTDRITNTTTTATERAREPTAQVRPEAAPKAQAARQQAVFAEPSRQLDVGGIGAGRSRYRARVSVASLAEMRKSMRQAQPTQHATLPARRAAQSAPLRTQLSRKLPTRRPKPSPLHRACRLTVAAQPLAARRLRGSRTSFHLT
jgi:hypothetical protein